MLSEAHMKADKEAVDRQRTAFEQSRKLIRDRADMNNEELARYYRMARYNSNFAAGKYDYYIARQWERAADAIAETMKVRGI